MLAPAGGLDDARRFYAELVGLTEIERPETMGGTGAWFRAGAQELHVSEHEPFAPATKAHPALLVSDLSAFKERLRAEGCPVIEDEPLEGFDRLYTADPFGNRIELMEPR